MSKRIRRTLAWMFVVLLAVAISAGGFVVGYSYVLSQNDRFERFDRQGILITPETPGAVMVVIPRGSDTADIAAVLQEKGLIEQPLVFQLLSKFNGFDGSYMAGTHYLTRAMNYDEIMYVLSLKPRSVRITFPEGMTYLEVKAKLKAAGMMFDEARMDTMMNQPALFLDYAFVTKIPQAEGRDWLLQGYLFPDTYEFDVNMDEESILRVFLDNTRRKLLPEYEERAAKLGVTLDEVINLASIVQSESGQIVEFSAVAGVFWNRLDHKDPTYHRLQSCATINYIRQKMGLPKLLYVQDEDITLPSLYNTYQVDGLPPGPINSPGANAIQAVLYPDKHDYLYFVAKGDGTNVFAKTFKEHLANVDKYINSQN